MPVAIARHVYIVPLLFLVDTYHVQVAAKSQEDDLPFNLRPHYKKQAVVEVLVDLLLDVEGVTVHEGLVFVLDEGLEGYSVSGSYHYIRQLCSLCSTSSVSIFRWSF